MKTIITKLLMLAAVLSASTNIHAYDFEVDGIYYNLTDASKSYCEVVAGDEKYTGTVKIPSSLIFNGRTLFVTSINASAFNYCESLSSLTISNYIKSIPHIVGCTSLKELIIENGEEKLSLQQALSDCPLETLYLGRDVVYDRSSPFGSSISKLTIGGDVNRIESYHFSNCYDLKELIIEYSNSEETLDLGDTDCFSLAVSEGSLETVYLDRNISYNIEPYRGNSPFALSISLKKVTIGNHLTEIPDNLFDSCNQLLYVTIGNKVKRIGSSAFHSCFQLQELNIPSSVTSIGAFAFYNCISLKSITIPPRVTSIKNQTFTGCDSLETVTIPGSVTSIEDMAFVDCKSLKSITIPPRVTSIKYATFSGCTSLESVTIPNSVTSIGESAFNGCASLKSIIIPEKITSIEEYAFSGCTGLTEINSLNTVPPTISTNTFDSKNYLYATLNVPINSLRAYQIADGWRDFWNIGGVNSVKDDAVSVISKDGCIVVSGTDNAVVEVYNLSGQLVYSGTDNVINVPSKGIYVVRISGKIYKITVL